MTSAKACEASTLQDMRKGLTSSSWNRTLHANFELLSRSTKRYALFRNCFNNSETAAAARRHNMTMNPPPMWSLSGRHGFARHAKERAVGAAHRQNVLPAALTYLLHRRKCLRRFYE